MTGKAGSILIVDDNKSILTALKLLLGNYFNRVVTLPAPTVLVSTLRSEKFDVVLLDMNFSAGINNGNEGLYWLSEVKKESPASQVVLFTAYADIDLAVKAIKKGAVDFVVKPWDNSKLIATLQAAYNLSISKQEVKQLREIKREFRSEASMFWGDSEAMRTLRQMIEKVAPTDATILIAGENGTGKDMLAREIHALSARRDESLVSVDMGALTETLFESELFGHVKGAFTDARSDRAGKFEVASGGTLFLDEIGNLPYHLQSKLLSVIQSRTVTRVGSNTPVPVDIRLICATNRNLPEMVASGSFREDLFYRINTIHVTLPPLRDRPEDILPLAERFLSQYAARYGKNITAIDRTAAEKLGAYPWYGNIRELQHAVEKAVILCEGERLQVADFVLAQRDETVMPGGVTTLEEMESSLIRRAMDQHKGNLSQVAVQLGITRQTLYNKIKKYNL